MKLLDTAKGDIIATGKEHLDGIYIVLEGSVEEHTTEGVKSLLPGDSFGEAGTLCDMHPNIAYRISEPTTVRFIKNSEFEDLMEEDGFIARKVYKTYVTTMMDRDRLMRLMNNAS